MIPDHDRIRAARLASSQFLRSFRKSQIALQKKLPMTASNGVLLRGLQVRILLGSPHAYLTSFFSMGCAPFWLTGSLGEPLSVPEMSLPAAAAARLRSAPRV
jgi:hypothetical protein